MNEDRIVIKGITQQNIVAWMLMLLGFVLGAISFGVADHYYHDVETYINFGLGIGGWYTYGVKYDLDYKKFFFAELWNLKYGYYLVLGIIAAIVGIALIIKTGGCDITVYNDRVQGKASGSKQINVPFNRIKEARRGAFNGFTLIGTGSTDIFYCFKNRDDIVKAINYYATGLQKEHFEADNQTETEAEKIRQYKELLDLGVINEEEFNVKKKQVLGL